MAAYRQETAEYYDSVYRKADFFGHENRLYRALVRAIVDRAHLPRGARVLDAGCGQGYLSRFLVDSGMNVWCCDLSLVGLQSLDRYRSMFAGRRVVADVTSPPFRDAFDFVFLRSCSLFNDRDGWIHSTVVDRLTDCVKVGGLVCLVYNSNLSGNGSTFINHPLQTFRQACATSRLRDVEVYAVNKVDCVVFGRRCFSRVMTRANVVAARLSGKCCEIVAWGRRAK
jgi:SAM-dependent methyltransferase